MNLLFTCVGRRVELIESFKIVRDSMNIEGNIFATDMNNYAPAMYFADKYFIMSHVKSDGYINELTELCNKHNVSAIIPTIDTELPILAKAKNYLETKVSNLKVFVNDWETIELCSDKFKTYNYLKNHGFNIPEIIANKDLDKGNYDFPLFIKPRDGSSSKNCFKINNERELHFFKGYVTNSLITEYIEGEEYTVDIMTDFDGKLITVVPRLRFATRDGEISKGKVVKCENINDVIKKIVDVIKLIGPLTVQLIKSEDKIKIIEINPRFGGGAPISIRSGANFPKHIYQMLQGEKITDRDYHEGVIALRYDQAVYKYFELSDSHD